MFSGFCATHRNKEHEGQWAVRERWGGDEFGFRLSLRYVTEDIKQVIACRYQKLSREIWAGGLRGEAFCICVDLKP